MLCNIQVFAKAMPSLFATNFEDFYIVSSDTSQIKALKLDILSSIATESSIPFILKEFQVLFFLSHTVFLLLVSNRPLLEEEFIA